MLRIFKHLWVLLVPSLIFCLGSFVTVQAAGVITLSPVSGTVGSSVVITGLAYNVAGETVNVNFDSTPVISGYPATAATWNTSFIVPAATSGTHTLTAIGSVSGSTSTVFNVVPKVSVNQNGTAVSVNGTGFGNSESVSVTIDGFAVASITSSTTGSWSSFLPFVPAGSHTFGASGSLGNNTSTLFSVVSYATISLSKINGPVGTYVTVNGTGFAANEGGISVTFDGTPMGGITNTSSTGMWTLSFTIPFAAAGPHSVGAYGASTTANSVPTRTFTVTPGLSLSKSSAVPGSIITATGTGFGANETGINVTWDGSSIGNPVTANSTGRWNITFTLPPGPAGTHSVGAFGNNTPASLVPVFAFPVGAGISINRTNGGAGTSVTVTGVGFGSNETGVVVTFDSNPAGLPVTANVTGSWSDTFAIPVSPAGTHNIDASGPTTSAAAVLPVTFTVTSSVSIPADVTNGAVGTSIPISGSGFAAGERITITYDGTSVGTAGSDSRGEWASSIIVPPSIAGSHNIAVKGTTTANVSTGNLNFNVTPEMSANSTSGYIGATVNIDGTGFAANSPIKLTYDGLPVPDLREVATDLVGSFTQTITIPSSKAGPHTIKVQDAQNNSFSLSFSIVSTALSSPNPISPPSGSTVGLTGDTTPDFRWSPVTGPNGGITYNLQIASNPDFQKPLIEKTGLTLPRYTLSKLESLPRGTYYWRVTAVDAASNQSPWSKPATLQSGFISTSVFITLVIVILAGVLSTSYIFGLRPWMRRKKEEEAAREAVQPYVQAPEIIISRLSSPEYPALGPAEPGQETVRALPWRLTLPEAPKPLAGGILALPPADQARLKIMVDFTKALPLIAPENNANWLIELAENVSGEAASPTLYARLVNSEIELRYAPVWMRHPIFTDLQTILEGQPILEDLNSFIESVNHNASEAILLLQDIHKDTSAEVTWDVIANGGWGFVAGVYTDAVSWFQGKYLREPSDRDYSVKPNLKNGEESAAFGLYAESNTPFAGLLIHTPDEKEAVQLKALHLKLRRAYRNSDEAREVVNNLTQLDVQRDRLLDAFSQFNRLNPIR